jgi:cellobiose-specific phosphotransferase system component IIC
MELFIPSLIALLIGVSICFFVLPAIAVPLLITGSVVVLLAALYVHYTRFGVMEYERSTWQYNLRKYGNWVILAVVLLFAYGYYVMNESNSYYTQSPALPALSMPTMIGGGFEEVFRTSASRISDLMRKGRI